MQHHRTPPPPPSAPAATTTDYYLPLNGVPGFHFETNVKYNRQTDCEWIEKRNGEKKTNHVHSSNFRWNCASEAKIFLQNRLTIIFFWFFVSFEIKRGRWSACVSRRNSKNAEKNSTWKWITSFCAVSIAERIMKKNGQEKKRTHRPNGFEYMQFNRKIPFGVCVDSAHRLNSNSDLKIKIITRDARSICVVRIHCDQTKQINLYKYILCANGVKINWYNLVLFNLCSFVFGAQHSVERKWKMKNEHYDIQRITIQSQFISEKWLQKHSSRIHI